MHYYYWLIGIAALLLLAAPCLAEVTLKQDEAHIILENEFLRLRVTPAQGGVIDQFLVKSSNSQLCGESCYLLGDHFWQQLWPGEFLDQPYTARVVVNTPETASLEVSRVSSGWKGSMEQNDLKITRTMTLHAGSPLLWVEVRIENVGKVGRSAGYWTQSLLYPDGVREDPLAVFRPSVRGVSQSIFDPATDRYRFSAMENVDGFVRDPQQGWMATLSETKHCGLAFVMRPDELLFLYNCMPSFSNEWQYRSVGIPAGKTWKTDFVVYPVDGFAHLDYASRSLLAAVDPVDAHGKLHIDLHLAAPDQPLTDVNVTCTLISARTNTASAPPPAQQLARLEHTPARLTFSTAHNPADPEALRFQVSGQTGGQPLNETFEIWYGAEYGENRKVDFTPLYPLPAPERHVTLLKPDTIEKAVNEKPHVLFGRGIYGIWYLPPAIFSGIGAEVRDSYYLPGGTWPPALSVFPASYEELMSYDIITLINVDAGALGATGGEMLKDFVQHGGTLVYGGDFWAYSHGALRGSTLEALLPVRCVTESNTSNPLFPTNGQAVTLCEDGQAGGPLAPNAVMQFMTERFAVKAPARVLLTCGEQPVVVSWRLGKGRVIAITGTILGKAPDGKELFYRTPEWTAFFERLLAVGGKR